MRDFISVSFLKWFEEMRFEFSSAVFCILRQGSGA
jgi:hypothetical protein